jgi:hypothetical protein
MRKKNFMGVGFLALFVMMAAIVGASPSCDSLVTSGGANVALNGLLANSISCTAEGLLFSNFQYMESGGSGAPEVDLTQNGVSLAGGFLTLNFNPNLNPNVNSTTALSDLYFSFTVSGPVIGAYLENNGLLSSIQEANCNGSDSLNGSCIGSVVWNTTDPDNQFSSCIGNTNTGKGASTTCAFATGFNSVSVWTAISVNATLGHVLSFGEGFTTYPVPAPEPITMSLMGIGLAGIGLLGRRLRK